MKEFRSATQILFGFLPEQTADLDGRIWKVTEWRHPKRENIDTGALVRELLKQIRPWEAAKTDSNFAKYLRQGHDVAVYSLDTRNGVNTEMFPQVWVCRTASCSRVYFKSVETCKCGSRRFGQLPFVGYHECGALRAPYVRSCPTHRDLKIELPGTTALSEIVFKCPECNIVVQKGLGFTPCGCGNGNLKYNVHRASPVYTPRTVVVVNAMSVDAARRLNEGAGPERALNWVLSSMSARRYDEADLTADALIQDLRAKGLPEAAVQAMVDAAVGAGGLKQGSMQVTLPVGVRERVVGEAVTVATATETSRVRLEDLVAGASRDAWSERSNTYRHHYPKALERCGLEAVDLVEKFPVLTGNFGFTRESGQPGKSALRPFRVGMNYAVYADVSETEALFVRLRPSRVAGWLRADGHFIEDWNDERTARLAVLRATNIPEAGDEPPTATAGSALLTLVHSYAHRFIRRAAVFAGIDRNALSELVVPHHLGFFVYAAARGDFVLGGLQAVFETELHHLLHDIAAEEHRCPLDPGCQQSGGACVACLHLGEPSCRYYNRFLDRKVLFGAGGFLTPPQTS
jgi:hypothetical protein